MITLKNRAEIEKIRTASRYAMEVLLYLGEFVRDGMKTIELEVLCAEKLGSINGAKAAFKGYNGFPYCLCVSVNDEVVHGMPGNRVLAHQDIVSLDFGVIYGGFYGDAAITYGVGRIEKDTARLLDVTESALYKGISQAWDGNRVHDISSAVQTEVEGAGFSVVREFVGHGIGRNLHEDPQIPNFGTKGTGMRLKNGMVLAIEPMVNRGGIDVFIKENGWTAVTSDGSLSAHFEHTIAITADGPEILSKL
jgi:methionyl aminopeptidase